MNHWNCLDLTIKTSLGYDFLSGEVENKIVYLTNQILIGISA